MMKGLNEWFYNKTHKGKYGKFMAIAGLLDLVAALILGLTKVMTIDDVTLLIVCGLATIFFGVIIIKQVKNRKDAA
jgi:uncharacterized membrane protein HdeD (DUF308 family)